MLLRVSHADAMPQVPHCHRGLFLATNVLYILLAAYAARLRQTTTAAFIFIMGVASLLFHGSQCYGDCAHARRLLLVDMAGAVATALYVIVTHWPRLYAAGAFWPQFAVAVLAGALYVGMAAQQRDLGTYFALHSLWHLVGAWWLYAVLTACSGLPAPRP